MTVYADMCNTTRVCNLMSPLHAYCAKQRCSVSLHEHSLMNACANPWIRWMELVERCQRIFTFSLSTLFPILSAFMEPCAHETLGVEPCAHETLGVEPCAHDFARKHDNVDTLVEPCAHVAYATVFQFTMSISVLSVLF